MELYIKMYLIGCFKMTKSSKLAKNESFDNFTNKLTSEFWNDFCSFVDNNKSAYT